MDKDTAEKLNILFLQINSMLNDSVALVRDRCDLPTFEKYRLAAGKAMAEIILELKDPLYERFPELLPDLLGGPYKIDLSIFEPRFYISPKD